MTRPRAGAGTAAHSRCAARAARQASSKPAASVSRISATTSERSAGFVDSSRPPAASVRASPAMIEAAVRARATVSDMASTLLAAPGGSVASAVRLWFDMTAPAHPLVFRPVIARLREAGHHVEVTARDYAQTLELRSGSASRTWRSAVTAARRGRARWPRSPRVPAG